MLYLFYGEDDFGVRARARATEERYADPAGAFNVQRLDGTVVPWDDVVAACSVLPFLTSHQVVRLSGLIGASARRRSKSGDDPAKAGASPDALSALVKGLPETTVLIMEEGALQPSSAHLKALNALDVPKEVQVCPLLEGTERVKWVRSEVARRGGRIDGRAATALAERLTGSLWAVSNAVDTLMSYAGPAGTITTESVAELVAPDEDVNAFHLGDAIAARQAGRALTVLHGLLASGMAHEQILAMLVGRVRDWVMVKACQTDRVPKDEAPGRLGWNAGKYHNAARGAEAFERGELPRAYQALVVVDEALKSRPGDERPLLLDMLVLTLATRGDPEALRQMFPIPLAP